MKFLNDERKRKEEVRKREMRDERGERWER
jgi:hypothetical protein